MRCVENARNAINLEKMHTTNPSIMHVNANKCSMQRCRQADQPTPNKANPTKRSTQPIKASATGRHPTKPANQTIDPPSLSALPTGSADTNQANRIKPTCPRPFDSSTQTSHDQKLCTKNVCKPHLFIAVKHV